jgi:hypothetical protein
MGLWMRLLGATDLLLFIFKLQRASAFGNRQSSSTSILTFSGFLLAPLGDFVSMLAFGVSGCRNPK